MIIGRKELENYLFLSNLLACNSKQAYVWRVSLTEDLEWRLYFVIVLEIYCLHVGVLFDLSDLIVQLTALNVAIFVQST